MNNTPEATLHLEFDSNRLALILFGEHNLHLMRIERAFGVSISTRGNKVAITGELSRTRAAQTVLKKLYSSLRQGQEVDLPDVESEIRLTENSIVAEGHLISHEDNMLVRTRRKLISPRTPGQKTYLEALADHDLILATGPAGTGKTYLAVAVGVALMLEGVFDRIILSRPAVEAGEKLGFLPGDLREKVDPYLRPLFDALYDMLPQDQVLKKIERGDIEIAPLAFMRGRTLSNAFIILDEAQNTTPMQMKMFLTRLGEGSRMVVVGDLTQVDLPPTTNSGLKEALSILSGIEGIGVVALNENDTVRHPLIGRIAKAYATHSR